MNPEEPETEPTLPLPPYQSAAQHVQPQFAPYQGQPLAPMQMTPRAKKIWIRSIVGFVVLLVVVGALWGTVAVLNKQQFGPEDAVKDYLSALQSGDVAKALELAPVSSRLGDKELLTKEIYQAATSRISGFSLGTVDISGERATVSVSLRGVEGDKTVDLELRRDDNKYGVFHQWKVTDGGLAQAVELNLPEDNVHLSVNGIESSANDSGEYALFPGTYAFNPYAGNKWVSAGDGVVVVDAGGDTEGLEGSEVSASPAFQAEVEKQLTAYLAPCLRAKTVDPAGCPNDGYSLGDETRKVVWSLTTRPSIDYSEFDGTFPVDLSVDAGEASLTYEYDASYGYGPKDWTSESDTSSLYLSLTVRLVGDKIVADFSAY